jgi:elongation factor Ts
VAEISAAQVKALREKTGVGMMDCKKALVEAGGDTSKALDLLRERGLAKARSKLGRTTSEGCIVASVSQDDRRGALVEVNCETDFVARTEKFEALCRGLAELVRENRPPDIEALLALPLQEGTASDRIASLVAALGENIRLRRFARLEADSDGLIASYIHAGGKIGSLLQVQAEDAAAADVRTTAHNLCMHVVATNPLGVSRNDIPAEQVEKERAVLTKQAETEGKPANVVEKIVAGRLNRFLKEVVLLEQPLVMDPNRSVEDVVKEARARVVAFRRFQLGEELEA